MIGLYIHIPFCDQKCAYCDFLSFPGRHSAQKAQYLDALCAEMRLRLRGRWQHPQTIFIGGGTPTALSAHELWLCRRIIIPYLWSSQGRAANSVFRRIELALAAAAAVMAYLLMCSHR